MNRSNLNKFIGKKYSSLMVIDIFIPTEGRKKLICKCDCGNITHLYPYQFGVIKSCGCIKHNTPYNATHKQSNTKLYKVWNTMCQRCLNPKNQKYYMYGNRGITVCDEWKNDFLKFKEWALSNGYKEGLTIDRIDNDKSYTPDNCQWTNRIVQQRNTLRNVMVTINNETKPLIEWCEIYNLNYKTINNRILKGWDYNRALFEPIHTECRHTI